MNDLIKDLDRVFSEYIRKRGADYRGFNQCFTCGITEHWSNLDAGHYIGRKNFAVRWNEINVQAQCRECNSTDNGMYKVFGRKLELVYGADFYKMVEKSKQLTRVREFELREQIERYSNH